MSRVSWYLKAGDTFTILPTCRITSTPEVSPPRPDKRENRLMSQWSVTRRSEITLTRQYIRWAAIGLNLAAACYYAANVGGFLLLHPMPNKLVIFLTFQGFVGVLTGVVAPALAVTALLGDRPH